MHQQTFDMHICLRSTRQDLRKPSWFVLCRDVSTATMMSLRIFVLKVQPILFLGHEPPLMGPQLK